MTARWEKWVWVTLILILLWLCAHVVAASIRGTYLGSRPQESNPGSQVQEYENP